jgi:hypothetical protein
LQKFPDAADGNQRNDKKERDETHALLERKVCDRSALAAARSLGRSFSSPAKKFSADNKKEHHPVSRAP